MDPQTASFPLWRQTRLLAFSYILTVSASIAFAQQPSTSDGFFARYQGRVTATQNEQPHWITPLVTVTPRLEQELRTDFVHQYNPAGFAVWNYGNSKGLEFIPQKR